VSIFPDDEKMASDPVEKTMEKAYPIDSKEGPASESDVEKGTVEVEVTTYVVDKALERKILWKFDLHILPLLAVMYLFK
jgi:hypothetical protein